ncbi:MAG: hypothetical protein BGO97_05965 [Micrococcales bacterium 70-64]|nr:MAG: hypothetical protein ABT06_05970 [Leifsonia sp. SCN 70-46]OJX85309.1 MAG: hypothetical protein BGO97_05965 [Micrococcales bacterium 70-64]
MQDGELRALLLRQGGAGECLREGVLAVGDHAQADPDVVLEARGARLRVLERGLELVGPVVQRRHRQLGEDLGRRGEVLVDAAAGETGPSAHRGGGDGRGPVEQQLLPSCRDERGTLARAVLRDGRCADAGHPPIILDECYRHCVG